MGRWQSMCGRCAAGGPLLRGMLVVVIATLVVCVVGDFEPNQVAGLYHLVRGPGSCEEEILMRQRAGTVSGDDIWGRNFLCRGGSITVTRGSKTNGNVITKWLAGWLGSIGVFMVGTVDETIVCGQRGGGILEFRKGMVWNFVDTRIDTLLDFEKVLAGRNTKNNKNRSPLAHEKELVLRDEIEYLIIGEECVYRQAWYWCFPEDATVSTPEGVPKRMAELNVGDKVQAASGDVYSDVFMWTHRQPTTELHTFVQLKTAAGYNVTMTASHHLEASGVLKPAAKVQIGDTLKLAIGGTSPVVDIDVVQRRGFFNPQTLHGDIAVDGIITSTYTRAVQPEKAHALLAPLRALYKSLVALRIASLTTTSQ